MEHGVMAVAPEGAPKLASRISWDAVVAGAVTALTIGLMLNALGAGIGATTVDATARASPTVSSFGIGAAIWILVSNLIALGVGGYVAARLSGTADNTDGNLHGVAVWGTMFLISAVLLGNLVSGVASGASSVVSGITGGAGSAVSTIGQQVTGSTDRGTIQNLADRAQDALRGSGGAPAAMTSDQRKAEMGSIVTRRVTSGPMSTQDRDRLSALVAAEYGISQQDAQARVAQLEQQAVETARRTEETARTAADAAAKGAATAAFAIFGVMLLGLIAAILGARKGTRDVLAFRGDRLASRT
jgi:hypothetical protein